MKMRHPNVIQLPSGHVPQTEELSGREAELLCYLAANAGRVVSRGEILERVWGMNPQRVVTRTVDMHIANLRAKLGEESRAPKLVVTVHGHGYRFNHPPQAQAAV